MGTRLLALAAVVLPALGTAGEVDVSGGYAYSRDVGLEQGQTTQDLHGFDAALRFRLTGHFAFVVDVGGQYGSNSGIDFSRQTLTTGPTYMVRRGKLSPFVHVLAGAVRTHGGISVRGVSIGVTNTDFGGLLGGGLDWELGRRVALRLPEANLVVAFASGDTQKSIRVGAGLVLRLGRRS